MVVREPPFPPCQINPVADQPRCRLGQAEGTANRLTFFHYRCRHRRMLGKLRVTDATLDVLQILLRGDDESYGWKIAQEIGRATGSVFPILARLEQAGWAVSEWETSEQSARGSRRRFYRLSQEGMAQARKVLTEKRPPVSNQGISWSPRLQAEGA